MLDLSQCKLPPYAHQVVGIEKLTHEPYVFLADEMGMGKGLQVIVASQLLFQQNVLDHMIVVAPACVKSVWMDEELGELKKHLFDETPATITEFHSRMHEWKHGPEAARRLQIWITNYEFLIGAGRVEQLEAVCGPKTLLVLDESSYVKSHSSQRTKACKQLRKLCGRAVLLNGTPVANSPLDLFSQSNILHPSILNCPYITLFKARYAIQTPVLERGKPMIRYGKIVYEVANWTNLEDLSQRLAPHMLRRLKADTLDLPEKLPPVSVTFELTPKTWMHYKAMRDDLVIWLQSGDVVTAKTAAIKVMRLAQITSGFVGGIEDADIGDDNGHRGLQVDSEGLSDDGLALDEDSRGSAEDSQQVGGHRCDDSNRPAASPIIEVGREKLDAFLKWLALRLDEDPNLKLLVQCRFRPEIARVTTEVKTLCTCKHWLKEHNKNGECGHHLCKCLSFNQLFEVGEIIGGQKAKERTDALRLLDPRTTPDGPVIVTMSSAGSLGLNLTAAHTVARLSRDYSLWIWLQGEDRVHRPGQTSPVSYTDFVARGPKGQRTVDHVVLEALMAKQDVAQRTAAAWVKALTEE